MLTARPIELRDANDFVGRLHRHHDPVYRDKCRVAAYDGDKLLGLPQSSTADYGADDKKATLGKMAHPARKGGVVNGKQIQVRSGRGAQVWRR